MIRKIINIDEDKCNGCGACAKACHEGAIGMADEKAKLLRDDYCDGLGDCLPACPTGAITFVERESLPYNEAAVAENKKKNGAIHHSTGCPGSQVREIKRENTIDSDSEFPALSQLGNWPVQIKLAPLKAPYFEGAKLLIAADCTAYSYASFHKDFIKGKVTLIGCPKLDSVDYSIKLTEIIKNNNIKKVIIVRMEVPCCGGLELAAKKAIQQSGKFLPWRVVTISINGKIIE